MNDLANVKVGDSLYVKSGRYDKGSIVTADRVTPSGRVVTRSGEFNPDGRKRGESGWMRTRARPATEDDIAGIYRYGLVSKISNFHHWEKLSADDLKAVSAIIDRYKLP